MKNIAKKKDEEVVVIEEVAEEAPAKDEAMSESALALGYPTALAKACVVPHSYACGLRDGTVIYFTSAIDFDHAWVTLHGAVHPRQPNDTRPDQIVWPVGRGNAGEWGQRGVPVATRGMEVRVSEIIWVMDAPHGE